jgi:ribosomal protein S18 acetylase RimI-like enzyme
MLAATTLRRTPFRGLRRLDISRDLRDIAGLIDEAFGSEPDQAGQAVATEFRALSWWGPLLWGLDRLSFGGNDLFTGFVWVEEGRVVGNVTLNRENFAPGRWLVSNVVVAETYRRRGISRQLMEAALDFLRTKRARQAFLMVRRENQAALRLYEVLRFKEVGGKATLRMEVPPQSVAEVPLEPGWTLRNATYRDAKGLTELARAATPESMQQIQPVQPEAWASEAEGDPGGWLMALLGQKRSRRWVVEEQGRILAYLRLNIARRKYHHLRFVAHPWVRGRVEQAIIGRALNSLHGAATLPVLADVGTEECAAIDVLRARGFAESRWLIVLARRMDVELNPEE